MTPYLDWTYYVILLVLCVVGLVVNILGLPGLWLIVASAVAYAWGTGFEHLGWWGVGILVGLALLAELIEFLAGSAGAKAAGGSKRGMAGAIVGGLVGGLVGTPILPIIGTIIGAIAGSFAGASLVEYAIGRTAEHSYKVGIGAAKGRFWGILSKTAIGLIMTGVVLIRAIPLKDRTPILLPPGTPTTLPSTADGEPTTVPATTQPTTLPELTDAAA
jgi:uncharacterized protein YqgC (DUF456 family)